MTFPRSYTVLLGAVHESAALLVGLATRRRAILSGLPTVVTSPEAAISGGRLTLRAGRTRPSTLRRRDVAAVQADADADGADVTVDAPEDVDGRCGPATGAFDRGVTERGTLSSMRGLVRSAWVVAATADASVSIASSGSMARRPTDLLAKRTVGVAKRPAVIVPTAAISTTYEMSSARGVPFQSPRSWLGMLREAPSIGPVTATLEFLVTRDGSGPPAAAGSPGPARCVHPVPAPTPSGFARFGAALPTARAGASWRT